MLAFVDAAVIAYSRYSSPQHEACTEIMSAVTSGRLAAITSVLVIEEVLHLELRGRPQLPAGTAKAAMTLFPVVLSVTPDHLRAAFELDVPRLGSADRLHSTIALGAGCDVIITSDRDFDHVPGLRRVDPMDRAAVEVLLASR